MPAAIATALVVVFPPVPDGVRAWLALLVGACAVADARLHAAHVARNDGLGGSIVNGLLSGLAGVVLLLIGAGLVLRPKG